MSNYIENPIKNNNWDPSKGDFYSPSIIKEDRLYIRKQKRKLFLIVFLGFIHIALLTLVVFAF